MSLEPKTILSIDGKFVHTFEKIILKQSINEHHSFEILVDFDSIEARGTHTMDASQFLLGKVVVITFKEIDFLGIITNVEVCHSDGFDGKIVLSGHSKTILLEGGDHMQSWTDRSLKSIVNELCKEAGVEATVDPVYKAIIPYQSQYQESHFQYIQRLAKEYNEWLYYDGVFLMFGKPRRGEPVSIEYGKDMDSININVQATANNHSHFTYNSLIDQKIEMKEKGWVAGLNEFSAQAFEVAKSIFKIKPKRFFTTRVHDRSQVDKYLVKKQAAVAVEGSVLKGTSRKQGLTIGTILKASAGMRKNGAYEVKSYGEFIITEITHEATGSKKYKNSFTALASGIETLPEPKITLPNALPQIATVVSHDDPDKKGRVKVQFQWQNHNNTTSWIRVMSPSAGSGTHQAQNRGFVFVPEKNDLVMVSFRYNDPNRPFVLGSLFNGKTGMGGKENNYFKTISTGSGHLIEFNDTPQQESITVTDRNKNIVFLDTVNKNIKISAPETIDIEAKNINFKATQTITHHAKNMDTQIKENLEIGVGNNMNTIVKQAYEVHSSESSETVEGNKTLDIQSNLSIKSSEAEIIASNGDMKIEGAGKATLKGGSDVKVSKG